MKKRKKTIVRWGLTLCCIIYIVVFFSRNKIDLKYVLSINLLTITGLTAALLVALILYSYRSKVALEKCGETKILPLSWFKAVTLSRFLGMFMPQAGNIYRGIYLKKKYQISYTRYTSSLFALTWIDTCLDLILAVATILIIKPDLQLGNLKASNFLLFLIALIGLAPILLEMVFSLFKFRNKHLSWIHSKLSEMLRVSVKTISDRTYMLKITLSGIIGFINMTMAIYLCLRTLDIQVELPASALFYVILKLSNLVIITPGNIGTQELAYGILSEQMHIGMAQGIIISLIIRILNTCIIIVLGTFFGGIDLLQHRKDYRKFDE